MFPEYSACLRKVFKPAKKVELGTALLRLSENGSSTREQNYPKLPESMVQQHENKTNQYDCLSHVDTYNPYH